MEKSSLEIRRSYLEAIGRYKYSYGNFSAALCSKLQPKGYRFFAIDKISTGTKESTSIG